MGNITILNVINSISTEMEVVTSHLAYYKPKLQICTAYLKQMTLWLPTSKNIYVNMSYSSCLELFAKARSKFWQQNINLQICTSFH